MWPTVTGAGVARAGSGGLGIMADMAADTNLFERSESGLRLPDALEADLTLLPSSASSSFSVRLGLASLLARRRLLGPVTGFIMWLSMPSPSSSASPGSYRLILYFALLFSYSPALSLGPMVDRVLDLRNR